MGDVPSKVNHSASDIKNNVEQAIPVMQNGVERAIPVMQNFLGGLGEEIAKVTSHESCSQSEHEAKVDTESNALHSSSAALNQDGAVELVAEDVSLRRPQETAGDLTSCRIPANLLLEAGQERVKSAIGPSLYKIISLEKNLKLAAANIRRIPSIIEDYARENPARFGLQVLGTAVLTGSIATVPVVGAMGFSSTGPVAGSIATGLQSLIGLVEAGSIFALCQSLTMGGAAVSGLVLVGLSGTGVMTVATLPMVEGTMLHGKLMNAFGKGEIQSKL